MLAVCRRDSKPDRHETPVNWTIPYLLRHTAYHVLDQTSEMQDRDLRDDASAE
jgi:hypothetical protein